MIPFFLCASDASPDGDYNIIYTPTGSDPFGKSNYVGIAGAGGNLKVLSAAAASHLWGVFGVNSKTTFGGIKDGSSNVVLFGERASRTATESGKINDSSSSAANYGAIWAGRVDTNSSIPGHSAEWGVLGHANSLDVVNWSINGNDTPRGVASSFHNGGANLSLGDGSTRFVSENLDIETLHDVVQMADGAVLADF